MNRISVVIPVYNASSTIVELVNKLNSTLTNFEDYEIILVDDKSGDNSVEIISSIIKNESKVKLICLEENCGQQKASLIGIRNAKFEYVILMDDDLENDPEDITVMKQKLDRGYDVVYGISKEKVEKSFLRNCGSYLRDLIFKMMTKLPKGMKVCSYRIMTKELSDLVSSCDREFVYISMEILKKTQKVGNVYLSYQSNKDSNYSYRSLIKLYLKIIYHYGYLGKLFSRKGYEYKYYVLDGETNE